MNSYVGITGFTRSSEVKAALAALPKGCPRRLMVGVLASRRTLRGETPRAPKRTPLLQAIEGIFSSDPRALNILHFAVEHPNELAHDLLGIADAVGPKLHGIQLSGHWPPHGELRTFREEFPDARVVLHLSVTGLDRHLAGQSVSGYGRLVTDVLLDATGEGGGTLDPATMVPLMRGLRHGRAELGIAVAGDLSAETADRLKPLLALVPELSCEAEALLRTPADGLDAQAVSAYLRAVARQIPAVAPAVGAPVSVAVPARAPEPPRAPPRPTNAERKRSTMNRILSGWEQLGDVRLGQVLVAACGNPRTMKSLLDMEDDDLVEAVEGLCAAQGESASA